VGGGSDFWLNWGRRISKGPAGVVLQGLEDSPLFLRILEEDGCCYFDSSKPHSTRSIGEKLSRALVVFTVKF
jgi:hypothetical protein